MRFLSFFILGSTLAALVGACATAREVGSAASPPGSVPSADQAFLAAAVRDGMAQVKLGQLAADKASDPRVRDLGKKMVEDFATTNDELRLLAAGKGIAVPADLDREERWDYKALARLCCSEFNRYYVNMMADYHIKDVRHFRREAARSSDPDLRRFAARTLPMLKEHRSLAQTLVPQFGMGRTFGGDTPQ